MASRPIVPRQARVVGGVAIKQQKKAGAVVAEGKNRHALNDIGNLVTVNGVDGKPQPQISRPITRSFCAQLLANAQAAAENNKKQACVNMNKSTVLLDGIGVGKKAVPAKPVQKKVTVKPKAQAQAQPQPQPRPQAQAQQPQPQEVIELSPDTEKEKVAANKKKKEGEVSAKKKSQTLTSVLTARSKAACGLAQKPKEQIVDIDAKDANNDLAGIEYVEDIYKFYKLVENESRPCSYIHTQTEISERMRAILVDWLIDVHQEFELSQETLYLTINIIDRFLSVKVVSRRELQLVGMGAMLIASKYEEIWAPEVNDLVRIADNAYSHPEVLAMEKTILGKLEWTLTVPTYYVFLVRFIKASIPDQDMENTVYFLAELGMMHYDTLMFSPSMVAASAVYAARCTLNRSPAWTDTLRFHTGFSETQLMDCARLLVYFHSKASESRLQVVHKKYSRTQRGSVSLLPPAKSLLSGDRSAGGPMKNTA
ncbi:Cyclin-B1-2 [Citrus sinensis]|nr:Cyclin-B1-2 [Citrus sinensis]